MSSQFLSNSKLPRGELTVAAEGLIYNKSCDYDNHIMAGKMAGDKPPALRYKLNQYVERRDSSLYMGKLPQAKFKWWVRPIRYAYIKRPLGTGIRIPSSFTVFNQNATDFFAFSSASFFDLPYRFSLY